MSSKQPLYRRIQRIWRQLNWQQFAEATACYYAFRSLIDDQVGRILATLRTLGMEEDTIVVFTSDHGDYMGAHRLMLKGIPAFEEAYLVPLIVSYCRLKSAACPSTSPGGAEDIRPADSDPDKV